MLSKLIVGELWSEWALRLWFEFVNWTALQIQWFVNAFDWDKVGKSMERTSPVWFIGALIIVLFAYHQDHKARGRRMYHWDPKDRELLCDIIEAGLLLKEEQKKVSRAKANLLRRRMADVYGLADLRSVNTHPQALQNRLQKLKAKIKFRLSMPNFAPLLMHSRETKGDIPSREKLLAALGSHNIKAA